MSESPDAESRFLEQLGQRVRTMRALRGMSRKVLAKVSGISERYIAQLESGKGNVSIVLLRRVSDAMGAHLEDLLPSPDPTPDWQMFRDLLRKATPAQIAQAKDLLAGGSASAPRRAPFCGIALIGLRGAGKSTLGRALAAAEDMPFVELNVAIEQEAGASLSEIHSLYGQAAYRRYEMRALERVLRDHDTMVLATPGSLVSEPATFNLLLSRCLTVWVRTSPEEHMARVVAQGDMRPMEGNREAMTDLRRILQARSPLYARADVAIDTSGQDAASSLQALQTQLRQLTAP